MLDTCISGQASICAMLKNAVDNDRISHAYIFDSGGNSIATDMAIYFAKMIVCKSASDKDKDNIFKRIDDGNYIDVKIIESDGLWIKKEQLLDLQSEFSKKAFEGIWKVYIIKNAEKMNVQTANSILKFLEEPVDNIVAILVTDNVNLLLPTIISRCQIIKLNKMKYENDVNSNFLNIIKNTEYEYLSKEEQNEIINSLINFIKYIEKNGIDALIYTKKIWHSVFKDRSLNVLGIEFMINFYYDVLKYISSGSINFFSDKVEDIKEIAKTNDIISLCKKIEILDEAKNNVKRNLNINLLIDNLIIEMCGDN